MLHYCHVRSSSKQGILLFDNNHVTRNARSSKALYMQVAIITGAGRYGLIDR